jgi:hypothetical protein
MSILFYHYKQLTGCISEVEHREARVKSKKAYGRVINVKLELLRIILFLG